MSAFTQNNDTMAIQAFALYDQGNTVKGATAYGGINFGILRTDPANNSYRECEANDNLFTIKTKPLGGAYQTVFIVDEDGDVLYDGAMSAFQDEDDVAMLKDVEDILSDKIDTHKMKEKKVSKKHKVIHVKTEMEEELGEEGVGVKTKKMGLSRFVSSKKLNMLLIGSIRQLNEKIEALEKRIEEK